MDANGQETTTRVRSIRKSGIRISKSKSGFRISIVDGNPLRESISVIGNPFVDFAFFWGNPKFKIEIRISQSNAPQKGTVLQRTASKTASHRNEDRVPLITVDYRDTNGDA